MTISKLRENNGFFLKCCPRPALVGVLRVRKKLIKKERTIVYLSTLSLPNHPPTQPTVTRLHSIRRETNISKKLYPKQ
jgi:hypothetical protein